MIVVKLMGGMGNQMFQYACGKSLSIKNGVPLILDHSMLEKRNKRFITNRNYELSAFGIDIKANKYLLFKIYFSYFLSKLFNFKNLYKKTNELSPYESSTVFPNHQNLIINGYYQSEDYFSTIRPLIKKNFKFIEPNDEYKPLINKIKKFKNSVAVLIRRDDYLNLPESNVLSVDYFKAALEYINLKISNPFFFIFTIGDTTWAKENFENFENIEIIENTNPNLKGFEKMRLMSLCKHNIIANSSFGWWSAWLNNYPDKIVIYPKKISSDEKINANVLKDRFPNNWIPI